MRPLFAAAALALAATACGPRYEDVEVDWTFAGQTCAAAGLSSIEADIAGQTLVPNQWNCRDSSGRITTGASLGQYAAGDYQLTLFGLDAQSNIIHEITTTLSVRPGRNVFTIDVPIVVGEATLHWTFGGQTCAQSGVTVVHATVDGQILQGDNGADIPCSQVNSAGAAIDGVTVSPLSAGAHTMDLVGLVGGQPRYSLGGISFNVAAGQNLVLAPNLSPAAPTSASADLTWTFIGNNAKMTCAQAGVAQVQIFVDPDANGNGGVDAGTVACTDAGASVDNLSEGNHSFAILGVTNGHLLYRTHHPPSAAFRIGLITSVQVPAESPP